VDDVYDPIEIFHKLLVSNHDWEADGVKVVKAYDYKNIDLRTGDFVVIETAIERDEFLGIGAMEFIRYVTLRLDVKTAESRYRVREISEKIRNIVRMKENWFVDGHLLLNLRIAREIDRSDTERHIYSQEIEIEWFEIEKRIV